MGGAPFQPAASQSSRKLGILCSPVVPNVSGKPWGSFLFAHGDRVAPGAAESSEYFVFAKVLAGFRETMGAIFAQARMHGFPNGFQWFD